MEDSYARQQITAISEKIDDLTKEVSKTQRFAGEVASTLWGDHERRDNGVRSHVKNLEIAMKRRIKHERMTNERFIKLDKQLQHYIDFEREETCPTKKVFDKHVENHKAMDVEEVAVKVAEINAGAAKAQSKWKEITTILVAALVLFGQIVSNNNESKMRDEMVAEQKVMYSAIQDVMTLLLEKDGSTGGRLVPYPKGVQGESDRD